MQVTFLLGNVDNAIATAVRRAKTNVKKRQNEAKKALTKAKKADMAMEREAEKSQRTEVEEGGLHAKSYNLPVNEAYVPFNSAWD